MYSKCENTLRSGITKTIVIKGQRKYLLSILHRDKVHTWTESETQLGQDFSSYAEKRNVSPDEYQFAYDPNRSIPYDEIDQKLSDKDMAVKTAYLRYLSSQENKNRFAHKIVTKKKFF